MTGFQNLPQELRDVIVSEVERADLPALARTVKLAHALVVPRLYHKIAMTRYKPILLFLRTIKKSKTLSAIVFHLELHWEHRPIEALATLATQLSRVLPRLSNLVHLTISSALGTFWWIYDDLSLPSLRVFRSFTPVDIQFFQRHPYLREVTIGKLRIHQSSTVTANLAEPQVLRLLTGRLDHLFSLCSDGLARPTLRRLDWSCEILGLHPSLDEPPHFHLGRPTLPTDGGETHRVASQITQFNYVQGFSCMSPPLVPPWASVERVGVRITHWREWPVRTQEAPLRALSDAALSFPNMKTLDLFIEKSAGDWSTNEQASNIWKQLPDGLPCFSKLRRVTINGRNWTRQTPTSPFLETECGIQDGAPDLSTNMSSARPW